MLRVPEERFPRGDPAALPGFLEFCREEARKDGRPRLGSITLEVRHIDPLAVLQSIYEPHDLHFYLERPADGEAVAGADAVESATFYGPKRFAAVRDWAAEAASRLIVIGDADTPCGGPNFFAGFTFADEAAPTAAFAPATVFLPRWQVAASAGRYVAVANVRVAPDADVRALAARVLGAHQKFSLFPYDESPEPRAEGRVNVAGEVGGADWFEQAVAQVLQKIHGGKYRKVVLSRALDLRHESSFLPLDSLGRLRERFPQCFSFSLGNGRGQSFIGASPERLARVRGRELLTEALAGSAPRGQGAAEDARLGRGLLASAKDLHEHQVVVDEMIRRLRELGLAPAAAERPRLLALANVQHLCTPVNAALAEKTHLLDVVAALHPTPAVGGEPLTGARAEIKRLEPFDRELYTGAIGWFNPAGDGEFVVAIRSALMDGARARLYAGAGIVEGSVPAEEKTETDLKLRALLDTLQ